MDDNGGVALREDHYGLQFQHRARAECGGSAIWSLLGQRIQPLFNPGLPAEKRAALDTFDDAANYHDVVLEAPRNVTDVLRAVENDAQTLAALAAADKAVQGSLRSIERQYQFGAASYVQLLIAQQHAQQTHIGLAAAQAQRLADSVALYQAVGAGGTLPDMDFRPAPLSMKAKGSDLEPGHHSSKKASVRGAKFIFGMRALQLG